MQPEIIKAANKEFRIVFTCNKRHFLNTYMRKAVGAGSLEKYIGRENALNAITAALQSKADKVKLKYRKHGRVEFYAK